MHELAICHALVAQVADIARQRQALRVVSIVVRVGPLSGVEPQLLERAYPVASAGTIAADAKLRLEMQPVTVRCECCAQDSQVPPNRLICAACGHWRTHVISGDELLLASVEIERPERLSSRVH